MTALVLAGGAGRVPRDGGGAAMTALVPLVCRVTEGMLR